jgi:hypothetical protein
MDLRGKQKHEEEHEDSKREIKARTTFIISRITILPAWSELTRRNQEEEIEVVMNNGVWKTYEWMHYKIQNYRFSQMEGEDYDDIFFQ